MIATRRSKILIHAILIFGSFIMLWPFIQMILTSLMTYAESISVPPTIIPDELIFSNYAKVFDTIPYLTYFINSVIVTIFSVLGAVLFSSMAGYALAKMEFKGSNICFIVIVGLMLVPGQMSLLPQYQLFSALGLTNTLIALILPYWFSAYGVFLMRQFFKTVPDELLEAALVDGYGNWQIFYKIAVPLVKPGIVVFGVQTAIWSWNSFLWPLVVNSETAKTTLPVGIGLLNGQFVDYPMFMAASAMAIIPVIVLYIIFQRQFQTIDLSLK